MPEVGSNEVQILCCRTSVFQVSVRYLSIYFSDNFSLPAFQNRLVALVLTHPSGIIDYFFYFASLLVAFSYS